MNSTETYRNKLEIPAEGIDTPGGYLYYPPKQWKQLLFLILSFLSAIFLGFIISSIAGNISETARGFIYFIYIFLFFLGYSWWLGLTGALIFKSIKMPFIKVLYRLLIHRKKPESVHDFLPTREQAMELMLKIQKNTKTFFFLSIPVGIAGGFISTFINASINSILLFTIIFVSTIIYGYTLFYFGRRGYLPLPEEI